MIQSHKFELVVSRRKGSLWFTSLCGEVMGRATVWNLAVLGAENQ